MNLRRMSVFAAVVDARSMHAASRSLGLTPSAVSQQIRRLERDTGVVLLNRSTRHLQLTSAGEAFYAGCRAMVEAAVRRTIGSPPPATRWPASCA